ncbi:polysaccharide deacetylase family sporulation protein PdaB [Paractinoplanes abujensis]|uniref:Peptidoglycan/xylan/chitin deacetylase (PgdA/CDA1 family) n=1 Tax=Paractinoplanes abujensis TaxID=882441 RepID=A0A7W7D0E2_9ACTN|nr:polysaccharide deacetylase family protein [Actinoplanes abujensis]MBB4697978.1 peptidoglycan/xylan/chitin deacetylase (PgdA/CDA1 family) [Actinoplanes abujensis]GID19539.1 polysaccharide deacetylase family sporulation protein PdaB [Actinoplanes abujensis]
MVDVFLRWREPAVRLLSRAVPGDVLWFVETAEPVFGLTFDDGPHPQTTPGLLAVLRRHRAKATFFLVGERIKANPHVVEQIVAEGHEVANHLMRDERSVLVPDEQFERELAETSRLLAAYGPVRWFRPGSGFYKPRMLRAAAGQNLRAVLGTVVAANTGGPGDAAIAGGLATSVRKGSIVVLHEGTEKRRGVVATTDELLTALAGRGLTAVTVSELVAG